MTDPTNLDHSRIGTIRVIAGAIPLGMATAMFAGSAWVVLAHDHAGESSHAHEWDLLGAPVWLTVAFVLLSAAVGTLRRWSSLRTWACIVASPLAGFAFGVGLLALGYWMHPLP